MKISDLFIPAFILSVITSIIAALLKIQHVPGTNLLFMIWIILTLIYIATALYEIYSSDRLKPIEKIMWTVTFLVATMLAAILYMIVCRPKLRHEYKLLDR